MNNSKPNKLTKYYFCLILIVSQYQISFSQKSAVDSIQNILQHTKQDTNQVNVLNELCTALNDESNYYESRIYALRSLALTQKLNFENGEVNAYRLLGRIYKKLGNHPEAIKNFLASLKLYEKLGNKKGIAGAYNNIGTVYLEQLKYDEALTNMNKALHLFKEINDQTWIHNTYTNLGNVYIDLGKNELALQHYLTALNIRETLKDWKGIAASYNNIGLVYEAQKNHIEAIKSFSKSLSIANKYEYKGAQANAYFNIAMSKLALKQFNNVEDYILKSLNLCLESKNMEGIKECYLGLSKLDSAAGNSKNEIIHYKKYIEYKDSIINQSNNEKIVQQQMLYDFDKKELQIQAEQQRKDGAKKRRDLLISIGIGLLFMSMILYFLYKKQKQKAKRLLDMEQMKNNISRDLHDEIGSTLSSISIQTEVVKNKLRKEENVQDIINNINEESKNMLSKMSDIVWSLNINTENLEQLCERIQNLCAIHLAPNDIHYTVKTTTLSNAIHLSANDLKETYLIIKEAIINSLKYAQAKNIDILIYEKDKQLIMEVKDDGIGFNQLSSQPSLGGNGIKNMKARASKISADIQFDSNLNEGTKIKLILPS